MLAAALFSLLYLLLTPAAVLAPALGEGGRAVFRKWASQLLGAVVSKLLFSFLLGVVLAVIAILADLEALGWWTQWLLMSAFWWGAFARRHHALALAGGALRLEHKAPRSLGSRVSRALESPRIALKAARWTHAKFSRDSLGGEHREKLATFAESRAAEHANEQVERASASELRDASERAQMAPAIQAELAGKRARLERIRRAHGEALAGGDARRGASLAQRAARLEDEIKAEQLRLNAARQLSRDAQQSKRIGGVPNGSTQLAGRAAFLDAQADLPASREAHSAGGGQRRDYAALAALVGYARGDYERLDPVRQRAVRAQLDRELSWRRQLKAAARDASAGTARPAMPARERRSAERAFDSELVRRMRETGQRMPAARVRVSAIERWRTQGRPADSSLPDARDSRVMRDAQAVASRRKRQLGYDRE